MKRYILLGIGRLMLPLPRFLLKRQLNQTKPVSLSEEHHRVRDFVVREIPNVDRALTPAYIAESVNIDLAKTVQILDDLERGMTFLWRGDRENVTWAYPVTVDETPHRYQLDSGKVGHAAGAIDAIATPFVQGYYQKDFETVTIETRCEHSLQPMTITFTRDLVFQVEPEEANPIVFTPLVNFETLKAPNIIDDFGRKSIFFWSEEHARKYRWQNGGSRGVYLNLEQSIMLTKIAQSAIFAFGERSLF